MITSKELEGHTSLAEGQQININHIDCPAGADRKKRLYIKRISSGWLCYCQHCQDKGFIRDDSVKRVESFLVDPASRVAEKMYKVPEHKDLEWDINKWPTEPKLWLLSYGLKDISAFSWEEKRKLLWLNTASFNPSILQARNFNPVVKSKYITIKRGTYNNDQWTVSEQPTIIVEDYISAKKVREAGYGARCLFGTKFDYTHPIPIKNPIIWLDNDGAGITAANKLAIKHSWPMVGGYPQPKELSHEDIKRVVEIYGRIHSSST